MRFSIQNVKKKKNIHFFIKIRNKNLKILEIPGIFLKFINFWTHVKLRFRL
jgi:hypothetical protein